MLSGEECTRPREQHVQRSPGGNVLGIFENKVGRLEGRSGRRQAREEMGSDHVRPAGPARTWL